MLGEVISQPYSDHIVFPGTNEFDINFSPDLIRGLYFVSVFHGNNIKTLKFLKQ
jgi:hypothetical protein